MSYLQNRALSIYNAAVSGLVTSATLDSQLSQTNPLAAFNWVLNRKTTFDKACNNSAAMGIFGGSQNAVNRILAYQQALNSCSSGSISAMQAFFNNSIAANSIVSVSGVLNTFINSYSATGAIEGIASTQTGVNAVTGNVTAMQQIAASNSGTDAFLDNSVGAYSIVSTSGFFITQYVNISANYTRLKTSQSRNIKWKKQTFTSSGTWNLPSGGIKSLCVVVVGAGGGGGAGNLTNPGGMGGCGGAGAQSQIWIPAASGFPSGNVTIAVGVHGTGGSPGSNGTSSSFGPYITAVGGNGGLGGSSNGSTGSQTLPATVTGAFGAYSDVTDNTLNAIWQQKQIDVAGTFGDSSNSDGTGGFGGNSAFGTGGARNATFTAGNPGSGYGAGGGGGFGNPGNTYIGGSGSNGVVMVFWIEN